MTNRQKISWNEEIRAASKLGYLLQIAFSTEEVRDLCTNESKAIQRLGARTAEALKNRLADIASADFISDLVAGKPRRTVGPAKHEFLIDLDDGQILTLSCNQPNLGEDQLDWSRVRRVKVVSVGKP